MLPRSCPRGSDSWGGDAHLNHPSDYQPGAWNTGPKKRGCWPSLPGSIRKVTWHCFPNCLLPDWEKGKFSLLKAVGGKGKNTTLPGSSPLIPGKACKYPALESVPARSSGSAQGRVWGLLKHVLVYLLYNNPLDGFNPGKAFPGPRRQGVMLQTSLPPLGIGNQLRSQFQKIWLMLFTISLLNKTESSCRLS